MIPSRTVSANCPALPRVIWPKYCSFSYSVFKVAPLKLLGIFSLRLSVFA